METNFNKYINSQIIHNNYKNTTLHLYNIKETIDLSYLLNGSYFNNITNIDIWNCRNLINIDIDYSKLEKLENNRIASCHFGDTIPDNMMNNIHLTSLDISQNGIFNLPKSINLPNLIYLNIAKNNFIKSVDLRSLVNLTTLNCSYNLLYDIQKNIYII